MQVTMKGVVWGAVCTIATTVLGKATESLFDVSIFKPIFLTLWGWMQGLWAWLGNDVAMPMWLVVLWCLSAVFLVGVVSVLVYRHSSEQKREEGRTALRDQPTTREQRKAFLVIGKSAQESKRLTTEDVRRLTGLSILATQEALDFLTGAGWIEPVPDMYGNQYAELTRKGRTYYLELERAEAYINAMNPSRIL
ncbi:MULTISPECIES: hypothetical protein [unclassified Pseudomonas]|uniref:hypothetical protein n=1 Tax=unclassified Pseudomonas TaxID=196821 RepID=UPI002248CB94|nr:hypothetical protein [Pseudomonas sp. DCB_BG]MCX2708335.1 hypothetical protein [Pseudomonas sp. DCB_BG]